jgi:hypothetical protein
MPGDAVTGAASGRAWLWTAAGLSGALLLGLALLLDRALAGRPSWAGPLELEPGRRDFTPVYTGPLDPDRTAALVLSWSADAPSRVRLHVRSEAGACLGERELALGPTRPGALETRAVPLRAAVEGPHTCVWEAAGPPPDRLLLCVRPRHALPFLPVAAAAAAFAAAGLAGALALARGRADAGPGDRARAVAAGARLGIVLALAALLAVHAAQDPLVLRAEGPAESP